MPCLRWQKRYENEKNPGCTAESSGLGWPHEGPGPAPGPGDYSDAPDHREHHFISVWMGVALGLPGPGRPAGPEYADSDADGGELHCGCGFHREIADRR